jgi:hypothetical protein
MSAALPQLRRLAWFPVTATALVFLLSATSWASAYDILTRGSK